MSKKISYVKKPKKVCIFLCQTCGLTEPDNIQQKQLSKTYKKIELEKPTLLKSLLKKGNVETWNVGNGLQNYLHLGGSHYGVDLLKDFGVALRKLFVHPEFVWIPQRQAKLLFVELDNGWVAVIAPADLRKFNKLEEHKRKAGR